ncbi:MAG: GNAT family N-acetyltransferase [Gemmataceae bacterium]
MNRIRPATIDDIPVIIELIYALAEYEKLRHAVDLNPERLTHDLFGPRPYAEVLMAEAEKQPVGFALYFFNYSTFRGKPGIYLEDLFVKPEFRGQGLGKSLMLAVARRAVEFDCGRMEWSVLDWNQPSIDFYRSLGAVPMDEWTMYRLTEETLKQLITKS